MGLLTLTRKSQCKLPHSNYILCFMLTPRGVVGFHGRREFGRGRRAVCLGCVSKSCLFSQAGGPMLKRSVPLKTFYSIQVHKSHLTQLQIALGWLEGVGRVYGETIPSFHLGSLCFLWEAGQEQNSLVFLKRSF